MVCKIWVILCPAKPPPALESWKGGGNAGLLLCLWSREQVSQLSPDPTARLGLVGWDQTRDSDLAPGKKMDRELLWVLGWIDPPGAESGLLSSPRKVLQNKSCVLTKPHTHPKKCHLVPFQSYVSRCFLKDTNFFTSLQKTTCLPVADNYKEVRIKQHY